MDLSQTLSSLIEILWLDLILSGDNAVALALATRALPQDKKKVGVNLGTILFILLRVALAYALMACALLPGFGLAGAALLLFSARVMAMRSDAQKTPEMKPQRNLAAAMAAALALDAPGALFNMTAIQGAAQGAKPLVMFGLALSIPLLALGSAQFITALRRPPLLWASAALLGWIAGRMAAADALVLASSPPEILRQFAPAAGALLALLIAFDYLRRQKTKRIAGQ